MYRILIAENEPSLAALMSLHFSQQDYAVDEAADGIKAYELVRTNDYDAIILDRSLPSYGAFEICKQVRGSGSAAAVFIVNTSEHFEEQHSAVESGADGCLPKPVQLRELSAKVKAVIRRRAGQSYVDRLSCGNLCLDLKSGVATIDNKPLSLRPMEYVLLEFLIRNQNRIFSTDELWRSVWKRRGAASDTVRTHLNMLRKKLINSGCNATIVTMTGRGYRLSLTES